MEDCIFCKIINRVIPAQIVYEDNDYLAFLDIQPLNPGHTLLIPKIHYRWVYDVPEFGKYWEAAKVISQKQIKTLNADFVTFLTMGNEVPHAHIHIIPRFQNDRLKNGIVPSNRLNLSSDELVKISDSLKNSK